ncbi:SAM-dependent methyltransferase [Fusobacterium necrophorum]|uniref:HsdM family class I SAM-dependent methyltransferase n=1 Tax=Fusobacterium necrophorum TaxID=859 RepID=UPI002550740D|nr:N-6 DNA methylase [Fusobacterium necrophorum]MDK4486141.1 SAM-dependent methyltransferase [Fusobacterium necrophorum]
MGYDIKTIREEFKNKGIYHTPEGLAIELKKWIPKDFTFDEVYDPTCGIGNLLNIFDENIKKYGQDVDETQIEIAKKKLINAELIAGDTLQSPAFQGKKFKLIMGNPPFSLKWTPPIDKNTDERFVNAPTVPTAARADYAFLLHILHYLADDGIAIVINFPGILYRGQREKELRKWFVDNNYIEKIIYIPGDTFIDTKIATVIWVLRKNKETTDIEFISGEERNIISYESVVNEGYNLSESTYFQKEEEKEIIDPVAIELEARQGVVEALIKQLEFSRMVCIIEGWDVSSFLHFLETIEKALKNYKKKIQIENKTLF